MGNADVKSTLHNACQALLRPIAAVLLRGGMTWREFSDLSKSVFVSVATSEFGIRGRPTNVSRVSILTGISRKEVKRQRELSEDNRSPASAKTTDATRLLSGWHQDDSYLDGNGSPVALSLSGPATTFKTLFAKYGGDTPEQTMVKELVSAGSAELRADGKLVAKRRYHMPANLDVGNLQFFGSNLFDHAKTLSNNLADDGRPKRFEGFAVDVRVNPEVAKKFHSFVNQRGQEFLEEIDDWLAGHYVDPADTTTSPIRLGLGVYAIEGPLPKGTLS